MTAATARPARPCRPRWSRGDDSLAVAWDVHTLCNVGGRERTESHYRALLADAGFELTSALALPLDTWVLRARKRSRTTRDE